jgi:hypothetical protein
MIKIKISSTEHAKFIREIFDTNNLISELYFQKDIQYFCDLFSVNDFVEYYKHIGTDGYTLQYLLYCAVITLDYLSFIELLNTLKLSIFDIEECGLTYPLFSYFGIYQIDVYSCPIDFVKNCKYLFKNCDSLLDCVELKYFPKIAELVFDIVIVCENLSEKIDTPYKGQKYYKQIFNDAETNANTFDIFTNFAPLSNAKKEFLNIFGRLFDDYVIFPNIEMTELVLKKLDAVILK